MREAGVGGGEAAREAAALLAHCMGVSIAGLYTVVDEVTEAWMRCYEAVIERRLTREPLQYITGVQEFMSLEFRVDRRALIPRPETEVLVEAVLEFLRGRSVAATKDSPRFADVGAGSGAIAVSVAKFANCRGYALDISGDALDVARLNARLHGVDDRLVFLKGDLLAPLEGQVETGWLDCVVSNPPYITRDEYERLAPEIRRFEPRTALLTDDIRGLYGRLARQAARFLRPGGLLAVEVGYGQAGEVTEVFERDGLYSAVNCVRDLQGIERVVRCNFEPDNFEPDLERSSVE